MHEKLAPARKTLAFPGTPASGPRERRPARWPWLVMPLIVLLVYYALLRVHQRPAAPHPQPTASQPTASQPTASQPTASQPTASQTAAEQTGPPQAPR